MPRVFYRGTDWIVERPLLTVALVITISWISLLGYVAPDRVRRFVSPPPPTVNDPKPVIPRERSRETPNINPFSVADADAIVVVESNEFFTPGGARTMRQVVKRLEALPHVQSVLWMDRVPILNIFGLPEPLLPRASASQLRFDAAREKALKNPLLKGQLLSADASVLLLLVKFDFFYVETNEDCVERLVAEALQAASEVGDLPVAFSVTGSTPLEIACHLFQEDSRRSGRDLWRR